MKATTLQLLHDFADSRLPLRKWSVATRQAAFKVFLDGMGSPEQHIELNECIDEVLNIVDEYDPPSVN
jgi:hypothetical protein